MAPRRPPPPVSEHYLTQAGLAVALIRLLGTLWPSVDARSLKATLPGFQHDAEALIHRFSLASATLAAREYERRRITAGIRSRFTVPVASPPSVEQMDKSLSWATHNLWNGDLLTAPPGDVQAALDTALTQTEGAAQKLVLDTGRATTVAAVEQDRQARAWAREARPNCCYFCAMLAGRGAVYSSAHAAGQDHAYHDHCRCLVVPVFGKYEPSAHARQWAADWQRLKDEQGSVSLLAWRRHFEGRAHT